ncbi:MAG: hypothetical protein DHS20C21_00530 [Gemmatimonadota bacterium]|nr:MAG: hypothetical protein DHS20C21_00530 [Gemmatimonadota bacterium]
MADSITLTMLGPDDENGHVRLRDFLRQLDHLHSSLASIDRTLSGGEQTTYYRVVALSHSSPATVVLEPCPVSASTNATHAVTERFSDTINAIDRGAVPTETDIRTLRDLRSLAEAVGKGLGGVSIAVNDSVTELTPKFASTIDLALSDVLLEIGSVEGTVERFNVHNRANVFYLYPDVGPDSVACRFPDDLLSKAKAAIMAWVTVTGTLKSLTHRSFPHEIIVQNIEIRETDEGLPDPGDLRGVAPDATGSQSSEDFIRDNRNAWG